MRKEGTNYLRGQAAYPFLDKALAIISGTLPEAIPKNLSDIYVNRLKRQSRELVATISNLRPLWGYRTDNEMFLQTSANLTKLNLAWWQGTYADQKIKSVLQWACISTGYAMPVWKKDFWGHGVGDIDVIPLGPRDVLPVGIERDHNLQNAYAVCIQEEVPISTIFRQYPYFADRIKQSRSSPSWFGDFGRMFKAALKGPRHMIDVLADAGEDSSVSGPTVDKRTWYIFDKAINTSGKSVTMGEGKTSWTYRVPYLGQVIPTHGMESSQTKEADPDDCLMYPLRRKMVVVDGLVLGDGPAENWHGQVPLAKFTLDLWPDQFLGYSVIHDAWSIQKAMNNNLRAAQDWMNKQLKPDVKFDPQGAAAKDIQKYDPRVPGQKIPVDTRLGEAFDLIQMPALQNGIDFIAFHELLKKEMDHMLAIPDMKELARAAQIPSDNTLDKLQEIAGPVVEDISRSMEQPLTQMGEMVKSMFYQFYPDQRKMAILGADGKQQYFSFDRKMLIPDGFADKERWNGVEFLVPRNMERARLARSECVLQIVPGSLHQITQIKDKMFMLALWRDGRFPIDPQTLAERFEMTQFGELPGSLPTTLQRWAKWMQILTGVQKWQATEMMKGQAEGQVEAQKIMMQAQAEPLFAALQEMIGGAAGQGGGGQQPAPGPGGSNGGPPSNGGGGHVGRPPSGEVAPHMEEKKDEAGAPRMTLSESK